MKNIKILKEAYIATPSEGHLIAVIEGKNITNFKELHLSFAQNLHFPEYFGENLDALYDMVCDLSWIEADKVTIVMKDYDEMLSAEDHDEKLGFLAVLRDAAEEWFYLEEDEKTFDFEVFIDPNKTFRKDAKEI